MLATLAFVPPLLTAPGVVAADTKQYLYLDPARFLTGASSLWDPSQNGGWVTHQTIGYLWPMGPFFRLFAAIDAPVWVAQRLWIGLLLLAAGAGVFVLARLLGLGRAPALAAAVIYQLSPYVLGYVNRTSALLTPWAGLGWMTAFAVLAARRGGWRWPAAFALTVLTIGGINATALVLCGLGPVLWLASAAWVTREVPVRRVLAAAARMGVLAAGVSAWWIASLAVQARYGADVLAYSETVEAVSHTSLASEGIRGLGYWLFYGGDVTGRWNSASTPYLTSLPLIALGLGLALLAVLAVVCLRWRYRVWLATLIVIGLVLAVGAHPYDDPSAFGALVKRGDAGSTILLALRSSTRALPLVLLAFALALGAAVEATATWSAARTRPLRLVPESLRGHRLGAAVAVGLIVLAVVQLPAQWTGGYVDARLRRPEDLPSWWPQTAAALDAKGSATRVWELPGSEFAAYRWGTTTDAILPGLMSRPTITRDLLPLGSPATMDLLLAQDDRFQTGIAERTSVAPVARMLGVGDVVVRGDTAFERYRTARPEPTWTFYQDVPGLAAPLPRGPAQINQAAVTMVDEQALSDPTIGTPVPPAATIAVSDPVPIVRMEPAGGAIALAGSGDGVVDAAAVGLVDGHTAIRYAADLTAAERANWSGPLIITDSNRLRARQWRGSQDVVGFTESGVDVSLATDTADHRLPVFPNATIDDQTISLQRGAVVRATSYGEPTAYRPEDRPALALDGDPATAWRVGDRGAVEHERLRVDLPNAISLDHLQLQQAHDFGANRWITRVRITTSAGSTEVNLDASSRSSAGQRIDLAPADVTWIELEVLVTNVGHPVSNFGLSAVGIAELGLGATTVSEVVRTPVALPIVRAGQPLAVVLTRQRVAATNRWRDDDERAIVRQIRLPAAAALAVEATIRLSPRAPDAVLAPLLGRQGGATVVASGSMAGTLTARGWAALDGNPTTAWTTPFGQPVGSSLVVRPAADTTIDHLELQVVADGRHSVPTELTITSGDGQQRIAAVPAIADGPIGTVASLTVAVPALRLGAAGPPATVRISGIRAVTTVDHRYGETTTLPVAIAEMGLGSVRVSPAVDMIDSGCRDDLVRIDGRPVPVRVTGTTAHALAGQALTVSTCDPGAGPATVSLTAGDHRIESAAGLVTGFDVDRLVLRSPSWPGSATAAPATAAPATAAPAAAAVHVTGDGRTRVSGSVTGLATATAPAWFVLGQGHNAGWRLTLGGRDLGAPEVIDGGSNGWLVSAETMGVATGAAANGEVPFTLTWTPQRLIDWTLRASALAVLACLVLLVLGGRREQVLLTSAAAPVFGLGVAGAEARAAKTRVGLTIAVSTALLAVLVIGPLWGLVALTVTVPAALHRRGRLVPGAVAVVLVASAALYYLARTWRSHPSPGFGWTEGYESAHRPVLLAVVLVGAHVALHHRRDEQR